MSQPNHHQAWGILITFCFSLSSFAQDAPRTRPPASASSDEPALSALVEKSQGHAKIDSGEKELLAAGSARAQNYIGLVYLRRGDYAQAMEHFRQSLEMSESIGDKAAMAAALCGTGNVYRKQGNYAQALDCYHKSLAMSEASGDKASAARALNNIGNAHREQYNYTQALEYYHRSLAISQTLKDKAGEARTLKNIGHVHTSRNDYAQALEYYHRSLAISEALSDKVITVRTLVNIANVYRKQIRYEESLRFAERATALTRQIGLQETLWASRLIAAAAHYFLNRPDQARQAIEESIAVIETLRAQVAGGEQEQQRFFESRVIPYHAMVELLIAQNRKAEALAYAERARSRVLLDVLQSGRINITKAMAVEEQEQERRLNDLLVSLNDQLYRENLRPQIDHARLAEIKSQLQKARLDFESFETDLYAAHPELKTRRGEAQPLRLEEANALLPDQKTVLMEFVVTDEKTFLLALAKQDEGEQSTVGIKVYRLDLTQKELTDRVERFRRMLSNKDNRFAKPARELYDLLLGQASEQLRDKTRLIIAPDGPLWELPFQALRTQQNRYLIEDHTIFCVPSLTVLREMLKSRGNEARSSAAPTLLALGNPTLDEKIAPLIEAERQVQALKNIYGSGQSKVYVGTGASEEKFKSEAGHCRIIHLATHGILDDRNPMYSHLLLAQNTSTGKEDGMLEAWELMKMDLRADLVVLSACETARGRVGKGEGMIGLTWALFVSGVPTAVVSQWKVRSDSAAQLMIEFHRQLKARMAGPNERASAAESLREAALKLMRERKYQHPFHWAGFVVLGDGY